ncbi:hypothetical protein CAL26_15660 [Bordetella genomosp. 9]|uniref:Uncharacterized protein n=1 Tax=Bordetella genomosp. 9 TaxID=1416803 RepID=A0A261R294_9BORD|nr:hypothetical protein CAL26_15660 [Bordetella genomosp. 9]
MERVVKADILAALGGRSDAIAGTRLPWAHGGGGCGDVSRFRLGWGVACFPSMAAAAARLRDNTSP